MWHCDSYFQCAYTTRRVLRWIVQRWIGPTSATAGCRWTRPRSILMELSSSAIFCRRRLPIHRVKRRHSNLWSRYDLHVAGHDVALCEFNWWRFVNLLLARLIDQYCFARWRLSSSSVVVTNAAGSRARGRSGGRHCTAGQYGYVPLGRHLV